MQTPSLAEHNRIVDKLFFGDKTIDERNAQAFFGGMSLLIMIAIFAPKWAVKYTALGIFFYLILSQIGSI